MRVGGFHRSSVFTAEGVDAHALVELSPYQRGLLATARDLAKTAGSFDLGQMVAALRAEGHSIRQRNMGGLARSLVALAVRGLLYRHRDGRYGLPPEEIKPVPVAVVAAPFITPPTKQQLMAGRAYPRRVVA